MGIINSVMQGIGAGAQAAAPYIKNMQDAEIQKLRDDRLNEFMTTRQERGFEHADKSQEKSQAFTAGENVLGREQQTKLQESGFAHADTSQERGFTQAKTMQDAQQAFTAEQNSQQRTLTREQIASHERVASANNSTALKVASIGGTVQQDKDGNMLFFDKSGKPTQIMDPNDPAKPLKGYKDLTPAAKAYIDVIKAQLVDLDRADIAAMGDQTQLAAIAKRRADLTAKQLNVLTGGIEMAKSAKTEPSTVDIDMLRRNPIAKTLFDAKFGVGEADKYLSAGEAQLTTGMPLAAEPPGTPNPDIGVRGKGLIGRKRALIAADAEAEAERRRKLEDQGAGYGIGY